jgi:hypothetical protein
MSIIIESNIPKELLKKGYWFRASCQTLFIITLEFNYSKNNGQLCNVLATASEVQTEYLDNFDTTTIENNSPVLYFTCCDPVEDWYLKIDIWSKYFFPPILS